MSESTAFPAGHDVTYRPIAYVENAFAQPAPAEQMRAVVSKIVLDPAFAAGLEGLAVGQHIQVIFHCHRSEGYELSQHPRGDQSRPLRGVFTIRSPRRPNPIGITVVQLVGIDGNVLRVRGLDAIDGTPVLDLKPA